MLYSVTLAGWGTTSYKIYTCSATKAIESVVQSEFETGLVHCKAAEKATALIHWLHVKRTAMADEEEEEESSFLDRLHSCIFLLLEEATDGEGDGGLNVRSHQELSSSRDGRKGRSRKSLSTSQHGSTLVQGRRNVRTNQSLSARQEISHGSDAGSLGGRRSRTPDIDSWNDFPPIGAQSQSPTSEPATRCVSFDSH